MVSLLPTLGALLVHPLRLDAAASGKQHSAGEAAAARAHSNDTTIGDSGSGCGRRDGRSVAGAGGHPATHPACTSTHSTDSTIGNSSSMQGGGWHATHPAHAAHHVARGRDRRVVVGRVLGVRTARVWPGLQSTKPTTESPQQTHACHTASASALVGFAASGCVPAQHDRVSTRPCCTKQHGGARHMCAVRLCCAVLRCAALCCAVLRCAALRCAVLRCPALVLVRVRAH